MCVHVFTEFNVKMNSYLIVIFKYIYVWLGVAVIVYIYLHSKHPDVLVCTFSAYPTEGLTSISDKFPAFYTHKYTQKKVTFTNRVHAHLGQKCSRFNSNKDILPQKIISNCPSVYRN